MKITLQQAKEILEAVPGESTLANCFSAKDVQHEALDCKTPGALASRYAEIVSEYDMGADMPDQERKQVYAQARQISVEIRKAILSVFGAE